MLETQIPLVDPPCLNSSIGPHNHSRWSLPLITVLVHLVAASKGVCCFSCCYYCCCFCARPIK